MIPVQEASLTLNPCLLQRCCSDLWPPCGRNYFFPLTHFRRIFSFSPLNQLNVRPFSSEEEVDFGRDSLTAGSGEVLSLNRSVDHVAPHCLHHVTAAAAALLAELRADAALNVASAQRQKGNEASDELLLDDAGLEEAACRDRGRESFLHLTAMKQQLSLFDQVKSKWLFQQCVSNIYLIIGALLSFSDYMVS